MCEVENYHSIFRSMFQIRFTLYASVLSSPQFYKTDGHFLLQVAGQLRDIRFSRWILIFDVRCVSCMWWWIRTNMWRNVLPHHQGITFIQCLSVEQSLRIIQIFRLMLTYALFWVLTPCRWVSTIRRNTLPEAVNTHIPGHVLPQSAMWFCQSKFGVPRVQSVIEVIV
jgi:hypothetical protein